MSETLSANKPEGLEDNARKFIVGKIDPEFLERNGASSFTLVVDWLETDEVSEQKLAYKKFSDGKIQILLISKVTINGGRSSTKREIGEEEYNKLVGSSKRHLEKRRYEFKVTQNDISFSIKYDEFASGKLYMLEVDASTEAARNSFDTRGFPSKLSEVTGDTRYRGYRITEVL